MRFVYIDTRRISVLENWKRTHPRGTTAEFKEYFDRLPSETRQVWPKWHCDYKLLIDMTGV